MRRKLEEPSRTFNTKIQHETPQRRQRRYEEANGSGRLI
jgi:hypothetical protein